MTFLSAPGSAHHADAVRASIPRGLEVQTSQPAERVDRQRIIPDQRRESLPTQGRDAGMAGRRTGPVHHEVGGQGCGALELPRVVTGRANQFQRGTLAQVQKLRAVRCTPSAPAPWASRGSPFKSTRAPWRAAQSPLPSSRPVCPAAVASPAPAAERGPPPARARAAAKTRVRRHPLHC